MLPNVDPAAFAASVWINDQFIHTVHNGGDQINSLFTFPEGSVKIGQGNVITVLQDHMGNDEADDGMTTQPMPKSVPTDVESQKNRPEVFQGSS